MSDAPYVLPGRGSTSDLRTYSPSVTLTWDGLARATQWPAVTTYQEFTREPPHLGHTQSEENNYRGETQPAGPYPDVSLPRESSKPSLVPSNNPSLSYRSSDGRNSTSRVICDGTPFHIWMGKVVLNINMLVYWYHVVTSGCVKTGRIGNLFLSLRFVNDKFYTSWLWSGMRFWSGVKVRNMKVCSLQVVGG